MTIFLEEYYFKEMKSFKISILFHFVVIRDKKKF